MTSGDRAASASIANPVGGLHHQCVRGWLSAKAGLRLSSASRSPAPRANSALVWRSLSRADLDMQEIEMRRQRARGRHSRLKDHLIALPAAEKDEDGFHERRTSAVRADRSCCEGNAAMAQILTVAEHLRKLTARSR